MTKSPAPALKGLIPELAVSDAARAAATLTGVFGFKALGGGAFALNDQKLILSGEPGADFAGHGPIDHVAMRAPNVDAALSALQGAGARLDATATPGGAREIPGLWSHGLRYGVLEGPGRARIEICRRIGLAPDARDGEGLIADHIGVCASDFAQSRGFFEKLGLRPIAEFSLKEPDGEIPVVFLEYGRSVVELYSLPAARRDPSILSKRGPWRALHVEGAGGGGVLTGPDGVRLVWPGGR